MARKVSPTLIGAFVVGALALAVGAVLVLAGRHWFTRPATCVMAFDSSVAGLSVGAPVQFRGVPLGRVSDIQLRYGRSQIVVVAAIDPSRIQGLDPQAAPGEVVGVVRTAVEGGLRAQLQLQSLVTGQLYVGLDFHPGTRAILTATDPTRCEIPTIPTTLAQVQDKMEKVVTKLEQLPLKETLDAATRAADAIQKVAASPEIPRVLRTADRTMQEAQGLVRGLNTQLDPVIGDLRTTLAQARRTIEETQGLVRGLDTQLDPAIGDLRLTLAQARHTLEGVGGDLQRLVQNVDARVGPLADSVVAAADSTQALMRDGQRTLTRLEGEITPTAAALREAAQAARSALQRAESSLDEARGVLSGDSAMGYQVGEALEELTRTARTLRGLSEDIERQPNLLLFGRGGGKK
jgi:paraquat-inducible protein B